METSYFDARKRSISRRPVLNNLILHIHPPTVPGKTLALAHTLGLGGMSVVLVMLLAVTGILLLFVYEPFPGQAYDSIVTLQKHVWFGQLVRNIHHWSGNILVIVSFLHLLRVYFTSAFHKPRRLNWIIGLGLLFLVLVSNFSGYLLPWDQQAYWAITICTGMLDYLPVIGIHLKKVIFGGEEIGPTTLSIFFTIHIVVMPMCLFLLMPYHFWLVRKSGGVVVPRSQGVDSDTLNSHVPTIPNLVIREIAIGLALIAFVMVYATIFDAPLEAKANPGLSPNPTKAPWYFLGIQEMLMHFHPMFAAWVIPVLSVVLLIALPYFRYDSEETGIWFFSPKGQRMGIVAAITALVVTPILVIGRSLFIDLTAWLPRVPDSVSHGLVPLMIIISAMVGFYMTMKKRYKAYNNETIQAVFILLLVSFVILTIICYWLRGPGMELGWPGFNN